MAEKKVTLINPKDNKEVKVAEAVAVILIKDHGFKKK